MKKGHAAIIVTILLLTILFIFGRSKTWDYEKTTDNEYNKSYNKKHPVIDTIETLYINTKRIFIRDSFSVGGHAVIGSLDGGSRNILIHDIPNCKPCNKFFLSLKGD